MSTALSLSVVLVGFSNADTMKLEKILSLTRLREQTYLAREEAEARDFDIVLGNADDPAALARAKKIAAQGEGAIFAVIGLEPEVAVGIRFIPRPIIGARIIAAMDELAASGKQQQSRTLVARQESVVHTLQQAQGGSQATQQVYAGPVRTTATKSSFPSLSSLIGWDLGFKVLVVDDSKLIQKTLELEFRQISTSIEMAFADSGEEALECIAGVRTYDLIFLDVVLPGMDGYETCRVIRKDPRYKRNRPIIMLSSKTSPVEQLNGYSAGCNNYLTKPIVHDEFQKMLHRVIAWINERRSDLD